MDANAKHNGDDAIASQVEVPPPPLLPLLRRCLLCMRLTKLLPVTNVVLSVHISAEDGKQE